MQSRQIYFIYSFIYLINYLFFKYFSMNASQLFFFFAQLDLQSTQKNCIVINENEKETFLFICMIYLLPKLVFYFIVCNLAQNRLYCIYRATSNQDKQYRNINIVNLNFRCNIKSVSKSVYQFCWISCIVFVGK